MFLTISLKCSFFFVAESFRFLGRHVRMSVTHAVWGWTRNKNTTFCLFQIRTAGNVSVCWWSVSPSHNNANFLDVTGETPAWACNQFEKLSSGDVRRTWRWTVASNETVVWHLLDGYPSQRAGSLFCGDLRGFFFVLVKVFFFSVFPFLDQWSKGRRCCTYWECKARGSLANLGCTSKISLTDWLIREIFLSES